jgi:molecular chaperone DnaK
MKQEAEKYAEDDKKKKELVDKKNEADTLVIQTRKVLKDSGDKFSGDARSEIEKSLDDLEAEIKKTDTTTESVDAKLKTATELVQKHAEAMYKAAGEKDKKEEPKAEDSKSDEPKTDTKAEEGEVVN